MRDRHGFNRWCALFFSAGIVLFGGAPALGASTAPLGGNEVIAIGSSAPADGWVLTKDRLLWSNDNGSSWRDALYTAPAGDRLEAVQFLDRRNGWVVASGAAGTRVERTLNAATSWAPSSVIPIPGMVSPSKASLSFVNPQIGFLLLTLPSSSNFSRGCLLRTDDGGRTWLPLPAPPAGGDIRFLSSDAGWLAGGPASTELFVTGDGGITWRPAQLASQGAADNARPIYSPPVFDSATHGLLAVQWAAPGSSSISLYETRDGGNSWNLVSSAPFRVAGGHPIDLHGGALITADNDSGVIILMLSDGMSEARRRVPSGLPANFDVALLSSTDARRGWAVVSGGQCAGFKVRCWKQTRIVHTVDGGSTYEDITPAFLRRENSAVAETARQSVARPLLAAVTVPEAFFSGGAIAVAQNLGGFDIACYPGTPAMQAWWNPPSPYYYVGAYIGGAAAYCTNNSILCPCPPASWFGAASGQGWTFLPIWVGIQDSSLSSDPAAAHTQGANEATAAAQRMHTLGFQLGSIVYYDFESTNTNDASLKAFVNGWVSQLHLAGFNAGFYGSYLSAADWQGAGVTDQPDGIWPYDLNVGATVFGLCGATAGSACLPDDLWNNHQRVHQYVQNVSDTQGGVRLTIDKDFADGLVATYSSGAATGSILVNATLDGVPWPTAASGAVRWQISGPAVLNGNGVPELSTANPPGTYSIQYLGGGPTAAPPTNPLASQVLTAGGNVVFTFAFTSGGVCTADNLLNNATCAPSPSVTLTASPTAIAAGGASILTWSSMNATSCQAAGGWSGGLATSGSESVFPTGTTTYTVDCSGAGGSASQSATVTVNGSGAPLGVYISVFPQTVTAGTPVGIGWATSNATSCTASGGWSGTQPLSGGTTVTPSATTTYTLTCTGIAGGSNSASATAVVTAATPTVNLAVSPPAVNPVGSATLQWSSNGMTSCAASGGWSGSRALSGSQQVSPGATTTYTLTCVGSSPAPQQLVRNGSFSGTVTEWTLTNDFFANSRFGSCNLTCPGYAYLADPGGSLMLSNNLLGTMSQDISLPSSATSITLSFWVSISTLETGTSPEDVLSVFVDNTQGGVLASVQEYSNLNAGGYRQMTFDLTAFRGQTVRLMFVGTTNSTLGTIFRVDDVSVLAALPGQQYSASATLTVNAPALPGVSLTATPSIVAPGQSSTLNWTSGNTTSCTASNGWSGSRATGGNQLVSPSVTTTYTLACVGAGGSATTSATVVVQSPTPTVTLSASPPSIAAGGSSLLAWASTNATACTASGAWASEGAKPTSGSESVAPSQSAVYTLTCTGTGGSALASASVEVNQPTISFSILPTGSPNPVAAGGAVQLNSVAVDSSGQALAYSWAAVCVGVTGNGTFANPTSPAPTWRPPSNGTGVKEDCTISVTATDGMGSSQTASFAEEVTPGGSVSGFFTLSPCRAVDTRNPAGPLGGPALQTAAIARVFPLLTSNCSISASAKAVAVNVTITQATAGGDLRAFAADQPLPGTTVINFQAGQTLANNAIISLPVDGSGGIAIWLDSPGSVHVIVDVMGYFQ